VGLGELWLASTQTGPGNYASDISEPDLGRNLAEIFAEAADEGEEGLLPLLGKQPMKTLRENPHRGKTEAWHVRKAEGRAGFAAGPRTEKQRAELKDLITGPGLSARVQDWPPEVRDLFGLIEPVEAGEVYMVPAGTLHTMFAIGEDSTLIIDEIQQGYGESLLPTLSKILLVQDSLLSVQVHPTDRTVRDMAEGKKRVDQDLESNPTVRLYDFGRRPGEYPELGFELTDPSAGLRRVEPVEVEVEDGATLGVLVACPFFVKIRLSLPPGTQLPWQPKLGSYRVIHCLAGNAQLRADQGRCGIQKGETVLVPAALEDDLQVLSEEGCELFDDAVPSLPKLRDYLSRAGAGEEELKGLFDPPRALEE
jgi:hypothetical protein